MLHLGHRINVSDLVVPLVITLCHQQGGSEVSLLLNMYKAIAMRHLSGVSTPRNPNSKA
jgi:hypothetical protein